MVSKTSLYQKAVTQMLVSIPPTFFPAFRNMRQPLSCITSAIALVGMAILYVTPPGAQYRSRLLGGCIVISCSAVNYTVVMSVIGSNVAGFTKKQITTSAAFFAYCVINIVTPQTFLGSESPRYHTGLAFVMAYVFPLVLYKGP